jgi:spoIIIJ-associated protein
MADTKIQELIREFVGKLGITIDSIELTAVAAHEMYTVRTSDSKRLIGPQGDHLRALNFLLRRYAERIPELSDSKFLVDVNGYLMVHIKDLENKARILAERVRTFRSSAEMTPMNAYDRMIIHAMFSNDPEVATESQGTGPVRHIILSYKQK